MSPTGLFVIATATLLRALGTPGTDYAILVMVVAAIWFARIAFQDRPLTAEEKQTRARLRRVHP